MGCITSDLADKSYVEQEVHYYKRTSRVDNNIGNGASFASTCPSPSSAEYSGWSTPPPSQLRNVPPFRRRILPKVRRELLPVALAKLKLSEDLSPAHKTQQRVKRPYGSAENSHGYYSATPTNSSTSTQDKDEPAFTPNCSKNIQTTPKNDQQPNTVSNLEMEMYMIKYAPALMSRTSTPVSKRRKLSSEQSIPIYEPTKSKAFQRWCRHLEHAPRHITTQTDNVRGNITALPEAITGKFFPSVGPSYTDLNNLPTGHNWVTTHHHRRRQQQHNGSSDIFASLYEAQSPLKGTGYVISTEL